MTWVVQLRVMNRDRHGVTTYDWRTVTDTRRTPYCYANQREAEAVMKASYPGVPREAVRVAEVPFFGLAYTFSDTSGRSV